MATTFYSRFPGEDFLAVTLPDYGSERRRIVLGIALTVILFIFVLPYFFATKKVTPATSSSPADGCSPASPKAHQDQPPSNAKHLPATSSSKKRNNKRRNGKDTPPPATKSKPSTSTHSAHTNGTLPTNDDVDVGETLVEFSTITSNVLTLTCIILIFAIVFFSNNNLFSARTILLAPVFTKQDCRRIIDMANAAADRNADKARDERTKLLADHPELTNLEFAQDIASNSTDSSKSHHRAKLEKLDSMLDEPGGWKKDRHTHYPTTDLNWVTDPFTAEDRAWLARKLNVRLAPVVERAFGIFRGAIRANDIFVVRYDATKGQPNLRKHTDSSHISFNILLNDEFEGGGTRFHNRLDETYIDVNPNVGEALISHSMMLHEGLATTKGTRYILVGFDDVDEKDPLTGESTNLSIFSSWLNFPWAQIRFKEGFNDGRKRRSRNDSDGEMKYSRYAVSLFRDLNNAMTLLIDVFAEFRSMKIVDEKDFDDYIDVMDRSMQQHFGDSDSMSSRSAGYASWFKGQQIDLDVFGNFKTIWRSRSENEDKFRGEDL